MSLRVELLMSCSHIITIPIESVLEIPPQGTSIRCAICGENHTVSSVGFPYHIEENPIKHNGKQNKIFGEEEK